MTSHLALIRRPGAGLPEAPVTREASSASAAPQVEPQPLVDALDALRFQAARISGELRELYRRVEELQQQIDANQPRK